MKMVKSLLLGTAAGVVAVSMGQAADLPVKAKPVEYVKVCSLYGAGFYYMPGTDMCIKIGGWVRAEATWGANGNFTQGPDQSDFNNRGTSNLVMRARGYITADAREQTAYGTARAYIAVGLATADVGNTILPSALGLNRAFLQWSGITAGVAQSFFDFYSSPATSYRGYFNSSDTGDPGWWLAAYTAQLGNGLSATISAEERRITQMINISGPSVGQVTSATAAANTGLTTLATSLCGVGAQPGSLTGDTAIAAAANTSPLCYGGNQSPDIVANLRLDQTWGSAQIMGALHEDNAGYYGQWASAAAGSAGGTSGIVGQPAPASGHPGDKWGFAVGGGLRLNFPMIAQGDYFQAQVNYTQGALRYVAFGNGGPTIFQEQGNKVAYGLTSDCVYGAEVAGFGPGTIGGGAVAGAGTGTVVNGSGCNLTTGFGVNAAYEHYWTPTFRESFVGAYEAVRYNAQANNILCDYQSSAIIGGNPTPAGSASTPVAGCNNNWQMATYATRFQWDVTKSLYLGVEVMYQEYYTAKGLGGVGNNLGSVLAGQYNTATASSGTVATSQLSNEGNLAITARIHKDFLP